MRTRENEYKPDIAFHPGETIRELVLEAPFRNFYAVPATLYPVVQGLQPVTEDIAAQLERIFNIPKRFWLNKQRNYDEYLKRSGKDF